MSVLLIISPLKHYVVLNPVLLALQKIHVIAAFRGIILIKINANYAIVNVPNVKKLYCVRNVLMTISFMKVIVFLHVQLTFTKKIYNAINVMNLVKAAQDLLIKTVLNAHQNTLITSINALNVMKARLLNGLDCFVEISVVTVKDLLKNYYQIWFNLMLVMMAIKSMEMAVLQTVK